MDSSTITEQLMYLGRIASGDGLVEGLTPGQWAILRYFAHANRFSQTPSAFAAFHGTTRGSDSQAIKSLVKKGYLHQARSESDGRSVRLGLTDKAEAIIGNDCQSQSNKGPNTRGKKGPLRLVFCSALAGVLVI